MLTGIGTVKEDNPRLSVRDVPCERQPLRVVIDSRLETPPDAAILEALSHGLRTVIICAADIPQRRAVLEAAGAEVLVLPNAHGKVDLAAALQELARRGVNEVMAEAGTKLNGSLLREGCVDELLIYQAPVLLGDAARGMFGLSELTELSGARRLAIMERRSIGADWFLRARLA